MKVLRGLIFVLCFQTITAQKVLIPELNSFQGRFINYPLTGPGADISTTRLLFDKKGFLWTGTFDGLYRYDGNYYKSYSLRNVKNSSLAGHLVTSLYEDEDGIMWIGTYGALNRLDRKTGRIRQFFPDSTDYLSLNNRIRSIHRDRTGILWLLTCEDVFAFDRSTFSFTRYKLDGSRTAWPEKQFQLFEDSRGTIWITSDNGLFRYLRESNKFILFRNNRADRTSISCNKVTSVTEDITGTIWCGTDGGGLNRILDTENGIFERIEFEYPNNGASGLSRILALLSDGSGRIWLFGDGIFASYYPGNGLKNIYLINPVNELFRNSRGHSMKFRQAMQDNEGSIWFLQFQGLLFRFNPGTEKLTLYPVPNWIVFHWIKDSDNSFWFGCANGNIWRLMLNSLPFQTAYVPNMFNVSAVNTPRITQSNDGKVWLALSTGIYRVDKFDPVSAFNPIKVRPSGSDTVSQCMVKDSKGNLWFSPGKGRILKIGINGAYTSYYTPYNSSDQVFNIIEDKSSNIWIQCLYNIFYMRAGSDVIEELMISDESLRKSVLTGIFDIFPDRNGNLWIATFGNGIFCFLTDNKTVRHYTSETPGDLNTGDYCLRVKQDTVGRIWVLFAHNGLYYFDSESEKLRKVMVAKELPGGFSFMDLFIDSRDNIYIYHNQGIVIYNTNSGTTREIHYAQPAGSVCSYQLGSGQIISLYGSEFRLLSDPVAFNAEVPHVYLSNLSINKADAGRLFPETAEASDLNAISLRYNHERIRFDLASMNFLHPENNSYKYFMEGIDSDTITMERNHPVEYTSLRPGNYKFWFTGSNNDNVWNTEGKTISIHVSPSAERSVLAFFTYGLIALFITAIFIRRHFHKLIRDKKLLETEVRMRTLELEKKNQQIEQLDRMKTRFFTEISHEFRTPLSLILGPIENLLSDKMITDRSKQMKMMEVVKRNSVRLLNLVNQLLDISRIDAGKMKITLARADLLKTLRILIYEYLSTAENRKIHFAVDVSDEPYFTYFDRDKIEKIVSNLLSNAFKFTPSRGTVYCKIETGGLKNDGMPPELFIMVQDTGVGISREDIDKIFDRFYRVEGQWEKDGGGTGIGLSLTEEFVTLLHGNIEVTSEKGIGTKFIVRIPLGKDHLSKDEYVVVSGEAQDAAESEVEKNIRNLLKEMDLEPGGKKAQVLVIEDNTDLRDFIKDNLSKEYCVYEASNGRSAINLAFARIPDIVVTDIIMPDINGIDVCRKLKNDERTSHIPVIILTAKTGLEDRMEGLSSGADDYLNKPFDINELKIRIANLLVQRAKLRQKYESISDLDESDNSSGTIDERFMKKVNAIIRERIHNFDFDVGVLQEELGMSRVHLYRKLKALTGESPSSLIHNRRMKVAARLIREKKGNLTEIALSIGISNPSYFSRSFREHYGISPRDFADHPKRIRKAVTG